MKKYYDVTIHKGVNSEKNICYNTKEKSFETLDEAVQWAETNWGHNIKIVGDIPEEYVGEVFRTWHDVDDVVYDLIVIRQMRKSS